MSKSSRAAFFSIGLVVGVGLALTFFVWAFPWFRDPTQGAGDYSSNSQYAAQRSPEQDSPHFGVGPFYGWQFAKDSLAQWVMAGFAVIGTLVSIWALAFLKGTLDRMAEANAMFADGARPWVRAKLQITDGLTYVDERLKIRFLVGIHNAGRSPARNVTIATRSDMIAPKEKAALSGGFENQRADGLVILPGDTIDFYASYSMNMKKVSKVAVENGGAIKPVFFIRIRYEFIANDGATRSCETCVVQTIFQRTEAGEFPAIKLDLGQLKADRLSVHSEGGTAS